MRFLSPDDLREAFSGKRVAIVGSGPSCLDNDGAFIDGHDIVTRVNNFKTKGFEDRVGRRTDVHYSFYGSSIKKTADELKAKGVKLCVCKCPDAKFMDSPWHDRHGKPHGVDFRYIYQLRRNFWFTDTYVPSTQEFLESFRALQGHVPTTGFACIYDILRLPVRYPIYLTGFDFFSSGRHNVDEKWRAGDPADPIGHRPDLERAWLTAYHREHPGRLSLDRRLAELLA